MTDTPGILVIDDEIGICEGVKRALTPQGFRVETALNGDAGLKIITAGGIGLVLLDVMMPGTSGIDLMASIHQQDAEIVCIIITGYATVELAVHAIKQGAYDFLTKPFSVDDLLMTVNQGLERRRLSLEAQRAQKIEAERQRLVEESARLEELAQAKQQFIRLVTHELQAPVNAIEYYLNLILEGYVPEEKMTDTLRKCIVRAQEERALIADLLELGNIQVLGEQEHPVPVQLEDALQQVLETFQEQASQKKIDLTVAIDPDLPPVTGILDQFKSLWSNLISNALKYTPERGKVTVNLRLNRGVSGQGLSLIGEVNDNGIGIPTEDQPQLFTEFFRAKNAKALNIPGTGLGLVIARKVVEAAGGHILVTSTPGTSTTFSFILPVAKS
jgi:two-component system sensor histidine kinase/response regulator